MFGMFAEPFQSFLLPPGENPESSSCLTKPFAFWHLLTSPHISCLTPSCLFAKLLSLGAFVLTFPSAWHPSYMAPPCFTRVSAQGSFPSSPCLFPRPPAVPQDVQASTPDDWRDSGPLGMGSRWGRERSGPSPELQAAEVSRSRKGCPGRWPQPRGRGGDQEAEPSHLPHTSPHLVCKAGQGAGRGSARGLCFLIRVLADQTR